MKSDKKSVLFNRRMAIGIFTVGLNALPIISRAEPAAGSSDGSGFEQAVKEPTFVMAKTPFELYGHIDVSVDAATKDITGRYSPEGIREQGPGGWMGAVSSNFSYFGLRGTHDLVETGNTKLVFQIESQVDMTATPGISDTTSSGDGAVKSALGYRNSYIGLSGHFGSVKAGKNDTPYRYSTARFDLFANSVGDYNSLVGNTGGDNRAEFDTRVSHAVWYESPQFMGVKLFALVSPGQNRGPDNSGIPIGEASCSGGNNPINTGASDSTTTCSDGSYGDVYSVAAGYDHGPVYATLAYELHTKTNRTGDEIPFGGGAPEGSVGVANEYGIKGGAQWSITPRTQVNGLVESLVRKAPDNTYNERTRTGYWVAVGQKISESDVINVGWGHANRTPGDPGDATIIDLNGTTNAGPKSNSADLIDIGYKHYWGKHTSAYVVYARMANESGAHYDLGSAGHGVMTDCNDGNPPVGGFSGGGGNCYAGSTLQAISVGMTHEF